MAKVGFWLQGAHGQIGGANLSQSAGGNTIMRVNSKPRNPQTEKQVQQRAKFKLISQLAEAFKDVIAMKREGELSPRNIWVKVNFNLLAWDSTAGKATMDITSIQLTKSDVVVMSASTAASSETGKVKINFVRESGSPYSKAMVVIGKNISEGEKLQTMEYGIVDFEQGTTASIDVPEYSYVWFYGIDDSEATSSVDYTNYYMANEDGQRMGALYAISKLAAAGVKFSHTEYIFAQLEEGE